MSAQPQLAGFMYDTVFCVDCLPRLHNEVLEDEAHVRREMDRTAAGALAGWGQHHPRACDMVTDYAVACWKKMQEQQAEGAS